MKDSRARDQWSLSEQTRSSISDAFRESHWPNMDWDVTRGLLSGPISGGIMSIDFYPTEGLPLSVSCANGRRLVLSMVRTVVDGRALSAGFLRYSIPYPRRSETLVDAVEELRICFEAMFPEIFDGRQSWDAEWIVDHAELRWQGLIQKLRKSGRVDNSPV